MINENFFQEYFHLLLRGKRESCRIMVSGLTTDGIPVMEIYESLFRRSLYQVGEYWEMNRISVATEHMATAITESLMIDLQPGLFAIERIGKKVILACVANEYHQVGAKMIADLFESKGWDSVFVGSSTPAGELIRMISHQNPDLVGLSLSIFYNMPALRASLKQIREAFPSLPVVLGGQAFRWGGAEMLHHFSKLYLIDNMKQLEDFIRSASNQHGGLTRV